MSVLIKGMEMPKNCETCEYQTKGACFASGVNKGIITIRRMDKERPEWCPLVELPEKHGRLIDADELIEDLKHDVAIDQDSLDYEELTEINRRLIQGDKDIKQNAIDLLEHARFIIEAEGAEE